MEALDDEDELLDDEDEVLDEDEPDEDVLDDELVSPPLVDAAGLPVCEPPARASLR